MSYSCLRCDHDVSELMDWDSLTEDYIVCPECGKKMKVDYDEEEYDDDRHAVWSLLHVSDDE